MRKVQPHARHACGFFSSTSPRFAAAILDATQKQRPLFIVFVTRK